MANWVADRIVETSTTTGTGSWSLNGAVSGYQSWISGIGNGNTGFYFATDGTNWEVGFGTVTSGTPNTLSRSTVIANSAGTTVALSFPSGTKYIFNDVPASRTPFWSAAVAMSSSLAYRTLQVDSAGTGLTPVGPVHGFKNKFVNGHMAINQRGTSTTITGTQSYTSDRWLVLANTGVTVTASIQTVAPGTFTGQVGPYCLRLARTVSAAVNSAIYQYLESVYPLAGRTITVSFWAKTSSGSVTAYADASQNFGTGGSPSSAVLTSSGSSVTITTTWTRHSLSITLPSISGKTMGSAGNDHVQLGIVFSTQSTWTVDITHIQCEEGPAATEYEWRPFSTEIAFCQRYYAASTMGVKAGSAGGSGGYLADTYSTGATLDMTVQWPVPMRTTPTVTVFSPSTGTTGKAHDYTAAVDRNSTAVAVSTTACYIASDPGTVVGARIAAEFNANAEY